MIRVYTSIEELGRDRLLAHFKRLDMDARQRRFHGVCADKSLAIYVSTAAPVLLVTYEEDGVVRGVVEVHPGPGIAEAGLSIEAPWRGLGLGHELFEAALLEANNIGFAVVELYVSSHNPAMLSLSRSFGGVEEHIETGLIRSCVETSAAAA